MGITPEKKVFRQQIERLEDLIQEVERFVDPAARAHAKEMVQTLLEFHGTGLAKILEQIAMAGEPGRSIIASMARDDAVGSLLLLHGLHPLNLETRVQQALDKVRPALLAHGRSVELRGIVAETVRLLMHGSIEGCASSAQNLQLSLEEAIYEAAPEVAEIEVEEAELPPTARVALKVLQR